MAEAPAMVLPAHMTPERWLLQLFSSASAAKGGVVRRQRRDVERIVGLDRFLAEVRRRGWSAAMNGGQIVIFCNREAVELVAWPDASSKKRPKAVRTAFAAVQAACARLLLPGETSGR